MQVLVVGAGVVGLAVSRAAAIAGHEVVVAEAAGAIGTGVSSRNSEVIHAGLYYPTGSSRAYHCTRARRMLYAFCASHGVPHRKCGKLVVATNAGEVERLAPLHKQAQANGVEWVELIDAAAAKRLEPALACVAAMHSPETGIVDSHRYMLALRGDLEDRGGMVAFASPIEQLKPAPGGGWHAAVAGSEPQWLSFDAVVNCAGLGAQQLARATEGYPAERVPRLVLAKGNYFSFAGRPAFSRLIYPVPVPGGLGVHVTLDLAGRMRFGPDVEWIEAENYDVDPVRAGAFYARIRDYWPRLPDDSLAADYAGIRPKLTGPGETAADFMIDGPGQHGCERLVHLFGIESPGLTSALSLAEEVTSYLAS
ncbi:MAG TPA: NAD(P)/FAD-dependent oxidoreductase [Xanthobacteraceae bacterium]|nr:NAD(P)/FAD-dependent oxidoreductase [Xanthobacteraceae bacterium]